MFGLLFHQYQGTEFCVRWLENEKVGSSLIRFTHGASICSNKESCPAWLSSCPPPLSIISSFDQLKSRLHRSNSGSAPSSNNLSWFHSVMQKLSLDLAHQDCSILEVLFSHPSRRWLHCSANAMLNGHLQKCVAKNVIENYLRQNSNFNYLAEWKISKWKEKNYINLRFLKRQLRLAVGSREDQEFQSYPQNVSDHILFTALLSLNVPIWFLVMRPTAKNVGQNISTQFLPTRSGLITATDAKFRPEDTATKGSNQKIPTLGVGL